MGLDIYVGSLTRYYSGDWENVVQRYAREQGVAYQVVRPGMANEEKPDPEQVAHLVEAWRQALGRIAREQLDLELDWLDESETPYFTDKPAWDAYGALLLWAAYDENPGLERPLRMVEDFSDDPAFRASSAPGSGTRYPSLLCNVEMWLPIEQTVVFEWIDPAGRKMTFGSTGGLLRELEELNERTWEADDEALDKARRENVDPDATLEECAKFALGLMLGLTRDAVAHDLPMKLDY